jgi:hypothetical protein
MNVAYEALDRGYLPDFVLVRFDKQHAPAMTC